MSNARPAGESGPIAPSAANEVLDLIGGRLERVASLSRDGSVLFRTSVAPGQVVPLHSHADGECVYVLTGYLEVFLLHPSPGWQALPAGRSVVLTGGVKHALRNPAREPADTMVLTDARLAAFFREVGRPATPDSDFQPAGPDDINRFVRTAGAYGYWMSSPAEHAALTEQERSPPGATRGGPFASDGERGRE